MKILGVFFPMLLLLTLGLRAQETPIPLKVEVSVADKRFERGDHELEQVNLTIRIVVTNVGTRTLLLYESGFDITHVWISSSVEDLAARRYEQSSSITIITAGEPKVDDMGSKDFHVLKPGKSVIVNRPLSLFTPILQTSTIKGSIKRGGHVFALRVYEWPFNNADTVLLSNSVKNQGHIWTRPLMSAPAYFEL